MVGDSQEIGDGHTQTLHYIARLNLGLQPMGIAAALQDSCHHRVPCGGGPRPPEEADAELGLRDARSAGNGALRQLWTETVVLHFMSHGRSYRPSVAPIDHRSLVIHR